MLALNAELHGALVRKFGRVKIEKQGVAMTCDYRPGANGRPWLRVIESGEYYVVRCPFCCDRKGHLYINHRWGIRDPQNGTRNLWLAKCFLEDCVREWEKRCHLADMLEEYMLRARILPCIPVKMGRQASLLRRVDLPSDFSLLTELRTGHPACLYVEDRGFSPVELANTWDIGFSSEVYRSYPGRLVIPFYACLHDVTEPADLIDDPSAWQIVGYQGRALSDHTQPKYLTLAGTRKSELLYGIHRVPLDRGTPVIICEGPSDVWRVGPGAVALLGNQISEAQCRLLRKMAPGRDIVVLLDPDAGAEANAAAVRIREVLSRDLHSRTGPGRVVVGHLPDDRDPGDCTSEEIGRAVCSALRRRNGRLGRRGHA